MDFIKITYAKFFNLIFISLFFFSCACSKNTEPSRQSVIFHEIIRKFEDEMEKDLQLTPSGSGGRVHEKIEQFKLFFSTTKNLSIGEARLLEVKACERLLYVINNYPEAELCLDHYPFLKNDITIYIRLNDLPGELHNFKTVGDKLAAVAMINGNVFFEKCHPRRNCYVTVKKEPFEESVKIVRLLDAKS